MGTMKFHGTANSTAASRALACLYEKGVEFEFVPVKMASGAHKKEPFISLNPFGQVPVLEDGDLTLFESRAITQYLAHRYANEGNELVYHENPKKMAILSVWMEVEAHQFDPAASKLSYELVIKPAMGKGTTDEAVVEEYVAKLAKVLDVYETRLAQCKYLGGDTFTLADLHHLPHIGYLMENSRAKKLFVSQPRVSAWCAEILARPAWLKVVATREI